MTARRRASERKNPFMAIGVTPATVVEVEPELSSPVSPAAKSAEAEAKSKYTALLDPGTAARFDELALIARRTLGRRVDKSKIMAVLIDLAADDASLREQVIRLVGER